MKPTDPLSSTSICGTKQTIIYAAELLSGFGHSMHELMRDLLTQVGEVDAHHDRIL